MRRLTLILASVLVLSQSAGAASIHVGAELTGVNWRYTGVPFNTALAPSDPNYFVPAFTNKADKIIRPGGISRFMSWGQTPASPITDWSNRSLNDLDDRGVTYETMLRWSERTKSIPWVNVPTMVPVTPGSNNNYAYKMGFLFGASTAAEIKVEYGNELWNGGDQMQGTWNMIQARGNPRYYANNDTQKMAQRGYDVGFDQYQEFERGARARGYAGKITWEAPGFVADNGNFANTGFEFLKTKRGIDAKNYNIRVINAAYAPGSPTDVQWSASDPKSVTINKLLAFADNYLVPWIKTNKSVATYWGAKGVDIYEAAIGSDYYGGQYWLDLNADPAMEMAELAFGRKIANAVDDPNATYIAFGIAGNPWHPDFGTWDIWNGYASPDDTPKARGVIAFVNENASPVPEPSLALPLLLAVMVVRRRK